jgi:lipoprotein-anchoring transpeptidase ErfK/SrfK
MNKILIISGSVLVIVTGVALWSMSSSGLSIGGDAHIGRAITSAQRSVEQDAVSDAQAALATAIDATPDASRAPHALLLLAQLHEQSHMLGDARSTYQQLLSRFPDSELVPEAQESLGRVNVATIFSPRLGPLDYLYTVQGGDSLSAIAQQTGVTVEMLRRSNGLQSDMIYPGQELKIVGGEFRILVDKSDNTLLLTLGEEFVTQYTISTGKDNATPAGTFTIVNRLIDPPWYSPKGLIPPDDPENILGTRWLGFDKPTYGIHGTTDPSTIGTHETAGCVRMRNTDVEELFAITAVGTTVMIVD